MTNPTPIETPKKTTKLVDVKTELAGMLEMAKEFKKFFKDLDAQRKNKIQEINNAINKLGQKARDDVDSDSKHPIPYALHTLKHGIETIANKNLIKLPDSEANDIAITADDLKVMELPDLLDRFSYIFPQSLKTDDQSLPPLYLIHFTSSEYNPVERVIKDFWNLCLALSDVDYRVSDLVDDYLQPNYYSTPYFKINIKVSNADEVDYFMKNIKIRIEWSDEINKIISEKLLPLHIEQNLKNEWLDDINF